MATQRLIIGGIPGGGTITGDLWSYAGSPGPTLIEAGLIFTEVTSGGSNSGSFAKSRTGALTGEHYVVDANMTRHHFYLANASQDFWGSENTANAQVGAVTGIVSADMVKAVGTTLEESVPGQTAKALANLVTTFGTATDGGPNSIGLETPATVNAYQRNTITIYAGTGAGQTMNILSNSTSDVTIDKTWVVQPDLTSKYIIWPSDTPFNDTDGFVKISHGTLPGQIDLLDGQVLEVVNVQTIGTDGIASASITDGAITGAKVANGAISASKFAAGALDAVWSTSVRTLTSFGTLATDVWAVTTRLLTAGTNIVLAKGVGVTGFNDLDAAGIRSAVGLGTANLDTQLAALSTATTTITTQTTAASIRAAVGLASANLDTQLSGINSKTTNLPSDPADASDIAAEFASLQSHGDATWSTATGFAVAGDEMTLTAAYDAAKTAATQASVDALNNLSTSDVTGAVPSVIEIADGVLTRNVSNVEATMPEHCLGTTILGMLEWEVSPDGSTLTIKGTDGTTTRFTKALAVAADSGNVITGAA